MQRLQYLELPDGRDKQSALETSTLGFGTPDHRDGAKTSQSNHQRRHLDLKGVIPTVKPGL